VTSFDKRVTDGVAHLRGACPVMARLIDTHTPPQFRPVAPERYFEVLVCSIVGQQLSVKAADTIERRLRDHLGSVHPERLIQSSDDELRALGLSRAKAAYSKGLAEAFITGVINPADLEHGDDASIRESLIALKGIGPWTAEIFMMFGLGHLDVWSPGDLGLRRAIEHYFGESTPEIPERWRPYRTIAAWYLWEHSDSLVGRSG
jgi:DNA-3-methyladenine glycosylase II